MLIFQAMVYLYKKLNWKKKNRRLKAWSLIWKKISSLWQQELIQDYRHFSTGKLEVTIPNIFWNMHAQYCLWCYVICEYVCWISSRYRRRKRLECTNKRISRVHPYTMESNSPDETLACMDEELLQKDNGTCSSHGPVAGKWERE
jgi:hypothetical protein